MSRSFSHGFKKIIAAAVLSSFIAGGVGAVTGPAVSSSNDPAAMAVNRTHKGDRLPSSTAQHRPPFGVGPATPASPARAPLGCEPAFSPVANPARAAIFGRCVV